MSKVAIVTCEGNDLDPDSPLLLTALADEGLDAELVLWDDADADFESFELNVIRSTWNYTSRLPQFLNWARSVTRLENPYPVIEYSTDKHYLADLARRGHAVVPSVFCDVGTEAVFPDEDFVVKPCVGAGSIDAERYRADNADAARRHVQMLHQSGRDALIQPYVQSVDVVGERALVFIDGEFSHAMTKSAMLNTPAPDRHMLFRHEQMSKVEIEGGAIAFAKGILNDLGYQRLLYARVDLVGYEGGWVVMELELVEPSLFLSYDDVAPVKLAKAIKRRAINATIRH
jgi:glutathione synthase/RimK-type ligase-like ATP-grasp enzyme